MTSATLDRAAHVAAGPATGAAFSVVVVDGSGREVHGVPVTARFELDSDRMYSVTRVTGADGEARFAADQAGSPAIVISAHGESLGPIRPRHGARLAVEA